MLRANQSSECKQVEKAKSVIRFCSSFAFSTLLSRYVYRIVVCTTYRQFSIAAYVFAISFGDLTAMDKLTFRSILFFYSND